MLKYNYTIIRDEGDVTKTYVPNEIPIELPSVVHIQGPNSSGKSTLLNILALGLFAHKLKQDEMPLSLREKLDGLINSDHQKLTFEFEIFNKHLDL